MRQDAPATFNVPYAGYLNHATIDDSMFKTLQNLRSRPRGALCKSKKNAEVALAFVNATFVFCLERMRLREKNSIKYKLGSSRFKRLENPNQHSKQNGPLSPVLRREGPSSRSFPTANDTNFGVCHLPHVAGSCVVSPSLAPHFFLQQAQCRSRRWNTSPLC